MVHVVAWQGLTIRWHSQMAVSGAQEHVWQGAMNRRCPKQKVKVAFGGGLGTAGKGEANGGGAGRGSSRKAVWHHAGGH